MLLLLFLSFPLLVFNNTLCLCLFLFILTSVNQVKGLERDTETNSFWCLCSANAVCGQVNGSASII